MTRQGTIRMRIRIGIQSRLGNIAGVGAVFRNVAGVCAVLGFSLMSTGCGGSAPRLVSAVGRVTHDGRPVSAGSIVFHPDAGNAYQKDRPSSLLQTDGSFTMKTFPFGDGVPVGRYRVTLTPETAGRIGKPKYADPESTPWAVDVSESGRRDLVFEVK